MVYPKFGVSSDTAEMPRNMPIHDQTISNIPTAEALLLIPFILEE
jgi:hypothetical protein